MYIHVHSFTLPPILSPLSTLFTYADTMVASVILIVYDT
jgi:hypothetical protein